MQFHFVQVPVTAPQAAQQAMNQFCATHRVLSIDRHFVADAERSYWAFCISYLAAEAGPIAAGKSTAKVDYRSVLNAQDFALFARLRGLRKTLADADGVPAYAVFTNEQLATLVQQRITSKTALGRIDGVGSARIRLRQRWECAYTAGHIDALTLQRAYDAVHAITLPAQSHSWRQRHLALHPPLDL